MHENKVMPEKLGADLKLLISDVEALLRAPVGKTAEGGAREIRRVPGAWRATNSKLACF